MLLLCSGYNAGIPDVACSSTSGTCSIHVPNVFQLSCKCRRCTDVHGRYTAAEDWCSVQIGLHDTGSWPCGFLPAYQRGVGWQLPMMQHEPRWLTACIADRQPQISWIYTLEVSNRNKSVLFFSDVENVWMRKVRMVVWFIFNMRHRFWWIQPALGVRCALALPTRGPVDLNLRSEICNR